MTEEQLKIKADSLLALREDLYEMHFHQVDRKWLIDAMIDFAANNHKHFAKPEKQISDDEIEAGCREFMKNINPDIWTEKLLWKAGAKWYREELKTKCNNKDV